ncbi:hypothetical protein H6503_00720 [Candidatus Woesearchaeota archaeon]|nr:hypothetical protein [Candidatus Woesearchaeota archaeon]
MNDKRNEELKKIPSNIAQLVTMGNVHWTEIEDNAKGLGIEYLAGYATAHTRFLGTTIGAMNDESTKKQTSEDPIDVIVATVCECEAYAQNIYEAVEQHLQYSHVFVIVGNYGGCNVSENRERALQNLGYMKDSHSREEKLKCAEFMEMTMENRVKALRNNHQRYRSRMMVEEPEKYSKTDLSSRLHIIVQD